VLKPHRVVSSSKLLFRELAGTLTHELFEWLFGQEGIDERAVQRFGSLPQCSQRDAVLDLRFFEANDTRLRHTDAMSELRRGHAERVPYGSDPATGRSRKCFGLEKRSKPTV